MAGSLNNDRAHGLRRGVQWRVFLLALLVQSLLPLLAPVTSRLLHAARALS